ncbi:hypothetical protein Pcinc_018300 [Petrolisthes cinctipes]|uniref:BAAT/Acyl-CoA thioester hydrolase C-terminal domain-containing protein n=1 Tax=Petrolisthes cinctipes TaxID=88211 RepID=A0AAE1FN81_PETCI|nr:hypothetical protein Pcinc_018300 [Petrolisthes cinctipes]
MRGPGPFPGVVDMFGGTGGLLEYRSAQMASRGFASLALAFFGYDDLPKSLEEFNITYFEEAVEFLLKHEKILKPNVGTIGISKGGDLALSLATYIPEVKAAVWINGCNANVQSTLQLHHGKLPGLKYDISKLQVVDGVFDTCEALLNPEDYPETIIPIEKADANFLFLVGLVDRNWKSELYADLAIKRLQQAGRDNYEVHKYEGTGHLIECPYSPYAHTTYHSVTRAPVVFGGTMVPHLQAQLQIWNTLRKFLTRFIR